jgi:probable rRNA maturation factor
MEPQNRYDDAITPEVMVAEPRWRRLIPKVDRLVSRAAMAAGGAGCVMLTTNRMMQQLNWQHRQRNKPTNVLSFEPCPGQPGGDIVLAYGVLRQEAAAAGRRPAHHLMHLVVHAALHLRGHDHGRVGDARRMEMAEARILHRLRVPNPWKRL